MVRFGIYQSYLPQNKNSTLEFAVLEMSLHKKMKFSIKGFFSKCDQIRSFLFSAVFCAVLLPTFRRLILCLM